MGDDGIAIKVAERIKDSLQSKGIEVIMGETDVYYCFNKVLDSDLVIILDASYCGSSPGSITINSIEDFSSYNDIGFSLHGMSILKLMEMYNLKKKGFIIGIEIKEITFNVNISENLNNRFSDICSKVQDIVLDIYKKYGK